MSVKRWGRAVLRVAIAVVALYLIGYTVLVTPRRFFQCLASPIHFVNRYYGDESHTPLPAYTQGNAVELLVNGNEALPLVLNRITQARQTIRWQVMLFKPDEAGQEIAQALVDAARRGVMVQLSFDMRNTVYGNIASQRPADEIQKLEQDMKALLEMMRSGNVEVRDNPPAIDFETAHVSEGAAVAGQRLSQSGCIASNHYDHRKILVIDGVEAVIGGMNVGSEYYYHTESSEKWQDVSVFIRGPAVTKLTEIFDIRWELLGGEVVQDADAAPAVNGAGLAVQVLDQQSGHAEIAAAYINLIDNASQSIYIASPYVSHGLLLDHLRAASQRGVQVTLVVPNKTNDISVSREIFQLYIDELRDSGVRVYLNNRRMAHTKLMIVDGQFTTLGSFNLNHRSIDHDSETNVTIDDAEFAQTAMTRVIDSYLSQAELVTTPFNSGQSFENWIIIPFS